MPPLEALPTPVEEVLRRGVQSCCLFVILLPKGCDRPEITRGPQRSWEEDRRKQRGVRTGCASLRGPLRAGEALLEARTQASVALFQTRGPLRYAPTRIWRAMKFNVLLRKRGGARARAAGAESGAGISNQPPRQGAGPPR